MALFSPYLPNFRSATPGYTSTANYGDRPRGGKKGRGWLGVIPTDSGVMTEYTVEADFGEHGVPMQFPLIVPTLTNKEIEYLKKTGRFTEEMWLKAVDFALKRFNISQSPYYEDY